MNKLCSEFNFYTIPDLCHCGCGNVVYRKGTQYIKGHNFKHNTCQKGIKRPAYIGQKISKTKLGHIVSNETKIKISEKKKGSCPWNKGIKTGIKTTGMLGKQHTEQWKQEHSGEKHFNWHGGISFLPYCSKFNKKLKEIIKERDNHACQLCGVTNKKLVVHHVHYDKENCYPDLITLCISDNVRANYNKKYYEIVFMNKLNDRGLLFCTLSLYKEKTV